MDSPDAAKEEANNTEHFLPLLSQEIQSTASSNFIDMRGMQDDALVVNLVLLHGAAITKKELEHEWNSQ